MPKSADAFRTISEVSDWLETPAHVLRFWESKFSQVKPVKRAGGRRYYRPADMRLLGGIKKLLHDDGMTIKGVQKVLREQGIKHVASLSAPLDEEVEAADGGITLDAEPLESTGATVVDFKSSSRKEDATSSAPPAAEPEPDVEAEDEPHHASSTTSKVASSMPADDNVSPPSEAPDTLAADAPDSVAIDDSATTPTQAPDTLAGGVPDSAEDTVLNALAETGYASEPPETSGTDASETAQDDASPVETVMPSFLHQRDTEDAPQDAPAATGDDTATAAKDAPDTLPAPATVDIPDDPEDDIATKAGFLSHLLDHAGPIAPETARELAPLMDRLRKLHDGTSAKA
ncbi:MerR family transcriptional regulator [Roseovarius sp. MMSF_3281]|uniref:MerR family transcriptional regulator n=1 Tax=Roseovarius sp. MMSF_3281 TaxID=3046694 RepID=UPI00273D3F01|nr:MerR family transcriptional regulator [Roseovarius sp. MMSF_3281]